MDPDLATVVLSVCFGTSLAVVHVVGAPALWIAWAIAMVVLAGGALVSVNR